MMLASGCTSKYLYVRPIVISERWLSIFDKGATKAIHLITFFTFLHLLSVINNSSFFYFLSFPYLVL